MSEIAQDQAHAHVSCRLQLLWTTKKMLKMQKGMVWLFWATDLPGRDEEVTENQNCSDRLTLVDDISSDTVFENLGCSKIKPAQSTRHHIPNFFTV